ncbi:MAG TPA: thioredoxin domain-containing protein, partial [Solirubrobacterales bacterium]|nr:thioredoxin domain-containing protein [Solirubrobacterales bacterium]
LEDHAFLLEALLSLYEASFEQRWFDAAEELAQAMIARFADPERGGFFSTSKDHEALIARRKELGDHPIPSGNSSAALGLLRLSALTGERGYEREAEGVLAILAPYAARRPEAFSHLLRALDFHLSPTTEVALIGDAVGELAGIVRSGFHPHLVLAGGPEGSASPPLLRGRTEVQGRAAAYVCERFSCRRPVTATAELAGLLQQTP